MKRMTKEQEMEEEESISTTMEEIGRVEDITFWYFSIFRSKNNEKTRAHTVTEGAKRKGKKIRVDRGTA